MKRLIFPALLAAAASGFAADLNQTPRVDVTVESEAREVARGYARAFSSLSRPPITLAVQKAGSVFVLEDVKSVRDSDGILIVEVGRGMFYLVNARDVLYITDGKPIQIAKEAPAH